MRMSASSAFLLLLLLPWSSEALEPFWMPCTELMPFDLLAGALPLPPDVPPRQLHMVQSGGSRGLRLSQVPGLNLSASEVFTKCDLFPEEFSLVVTFKLQLLRPKRNEFVLSLLEDHSEDRLLMALRVSRAQLHFLFLPPGSRHRSRVSFRGLGLDDDQWHTLSLAVTGPYFTLTLDCGLPLEIKHSQLFPSALSTRRSRFFFGSGGQRRGAFSGLLRQVVLVPGSDSSLRLCPSSVPSLSELSVPEVLKPSPARPPGQTLPYEAEVRVTAGSRPVCSRPEQGQLWFNVGLKALFLCEGSEWIPLITRARRLDYVDDYQDLFTNSETFDVEVFSIPNEGLFLATADRNSGPGSAIYKWVFGSFQKYQNITTQEARAWKHFSIGDEDFLAVANWAEAGPGWSVLYRWSPTRRRFVQHQTLETHSALDWEAFSIHNHSFLVVANHRRAFDSNHNIDSVIYKWNPLSKRMEVNQTLRTLGAYDWEFFSVGPYHFLAVANTFDGRTTSVSSSLYLWTRGRFQLFQSIPTYGAVDWEAFSFEGRYFLAVANSQRATDRGPSVYSINSTVYELSPITHSFLRFQDILTHSAVDWEFFTVGEEKFLIVGNSHDGSSYFLNSVIFRWRGSEGFVPVHSLPTFGCRDWEHFTTNEGSFLVYSSATSRLSKVFRLRTY